VKDVNLALRDFRWVNEALPGKVGGQDIDFVLSQAKTGRVLMLEMKPDGAFVSLGARLTFKVFVNMPGIDVWVVWGPDKAGDVARARMDLNGEWDEVDTMSVDCLAEDIAAWWAAGLDQG
jgi:hypothetical protein